MTGLVVTTCDRSTPQVRARAELVAARCGVRCVERRGGLAKMLRVDPLLYVVGRDRERVTDGEGSLHVDEGLLHAKANAGVTHPLIRAVGSARSVLDGTLGLAGDALHLAETLRAEVHASEASPAVFSLVESALRAPAERWAAAASRVHPHLCSARELFESRNADVVFMAPMFTKPAAAAPGYPLFRQIADHRILDAATLEAAHAAAPRVVVRVEKGESAPPGRWTSLPGRAVDYWVSDRS